MISYEASCKGSKIANANRKKKALENYYKDPSNCLTCGKVIEVPEGQNPSTIKKKKFCDHSCSAKYNNVGTRRGPQPQEKQRFCKECGKSILLAQGKQKIYKKLCDGCRESVRKRSLRDYHKQEGRLTWDLIGEMTKDELLIKVNKDPYQFKLRVTRHAQVIWRHNKRKSGCELCDFEFHAICHKKPVKDFSGITKIKEINDPLNLVGLCPNHHKLLDKGLLVLG